MRKCCSKRGEEGYLNLQYPDYMLKILIHGIADLYVEGVRIPGSTAPSRRGGPGAEDGYHLKGV